LELKISSFDNKLTQKLTEAHISPKLIFLCLHIDCVLLLTYPEHVENNFPGTHLNSPLSQETWKILLDVTVYALLFSMPMADRTRVNWVNL